MVARGAAMFKPPAFPDGRRGGPVFAPEPSGRVPDSFGVTRPVWRGLRSADGTRLRAFFLQAALPRDFEALRPGLLCAGRFWGPFTGESPGAFFASSAGMRRASDARRRFFPASSAGSCARLCSVPSAGETFRIVAARCASALRRAAGRHFCVPKPGMASFFSSLASSHVATLTMTR